MTRLLHVKDSSLEVVYMHQTIYRMCRQHINVFQLIHMLLSWLQNTAVTSEENKSEITQSLATVNFINKQKLRWNIQNGPRWPQRICNVYHGAKYLQYTINILLLSVSEGQVVSRMQTPRMIRTYVDQETPNLWLIRFAGWQFLQKHVIHVCALKSWTQVTQLWRKWFWQ
jgi:hypothetical protein